MVEINRETQNDAGAVAPLVYSVADAQKMLGGVSRNTIYNLFAAGQLRQIKIGARTMIAHADLMKLVDTRIVAA